MKRFDSLFIGLFLFSMFFGAGNLIFPPFLGSQSGTSFWWAMAGFVLTGVGLPLVVLLAISLVKGGVREIGNRVHPIFSTVFMVIVYLSIGPFLAIPRNTTVAFEMSVVPFANPLWNPNLLLFVYSALFFMLVYVISLNPSKLEKYMGRWIVPTLVSAIVLLCVVGFVKLDAPFQTPVGGYETGAFFKGFLEGYNTMDALASLAFGIVILTTIKQRGIQDEKLLTKYTLKAALVAGLLLTTVYVSIGWMGAKMTGIGTFENGTQILAYASTLLLGKSGTALLGFIFTLACFNTVVGLTAACGQYFSNLIPKMSYKNVILVVTLIGFTLANLGLNQILKVSVPFLVTAYPLTIVLIALTFFSRYFKNMRVVYGSAMLFTGVFAVLGGLGATGMNLGVLQTIREILPFSSVGLEWMIPALVGTAIGMILSNFTKPEPQPAVE